MSLSYAVMFVVLLALGVCLLGVGDVGDAHMIGPHTCWLMLVPSAPGSALLALAGRPCVAIETVSSLYEVPGRPVDPPPRTLSLV